MLKETAVMATKPEETSPPRTQRRRFARVAAPQSAVVECGEKYFTVGLLDISSNGARIRVGSAVDLDTITHIIIPDIGGRLRCEVIWQDERIVGLRFLEKPYEVVQKMQVSMRRLMVPLPLD